MQKSVEQICDLVNDDNDNIVIKTEADVVKTSKSEVSANQKQKTPAEIIAEEIKLLDELHEEVAIYNSTSHVSSSNMAVIHPRMENISPSSMSTCSSVDSTTCDQRSVYVGGVEYSTTVTQLKQLFKGCGAIQRATIITNAYDGTPKGFAYIEFLSMESVESALALNGSYLNGRMLNVLKKRTNRPGMCCTNRIPRGFRARQAACTVRGHGARGYAERLHRGVRDTRYSIIRNARGRGSFYTPY